MPSKRPAANDDDDSIIDVTGLLLKLEAAFKQLAFRPPATTSPPVPYYSRAHYHAYSLLGDWYGTSLGLQPKEVTWLNKFDAPTHAFMQIEVAREATVRLFVAVMNELETWCKRAGSTLLKRVRELHEAPQPYSYNYYDRGYLSRHHAGHKVGAAVFLTIFQRCENAVRERFGFKLMDADVYFTERSDPDRLFNQYFGDVAQACLPALARTLPAPDDDLEQALNLADPARWKSRFELLLARLPANPASFTAGTFALGLQNERNPKAADLYLEAARQLGGLDREATVRLYLHYLYHGARRYPFKPKPFLKRLQKALFPLPEHLPRFEALSQELLRGRDLPTALAAVPDIWFRERKKIALDPAAVHAARAQHAGTVELLNEYLRDEPAAAPAPTAPAKPAVPKAAPAVPKAAKIAKIPKITKAAAGAASTSAPVTFAPDLALTAPQQALLHLFAAHQLALLQAAVEALARQHGVLRNQLIDGLNEACYALLDDVLVEESGDGYTIYEAYYQKITA